MKKLPKTVTRRKILTALRKEPLKAGAWVAYDSSYGYEISKKENCTVCAVGAVLRRAGLSNNAIDIFGCRLNDYGATSSESLYIDETITNLLKEKKYLNALSVKFENQAIKTGSGKRTRKVLISFVKKHFPLRVSLTPW